MGTGLGSKAVVEVSKEKSVRVDGLIIDSPFHSFEYALKQMPNFYYYSSFFIDWPKLWDIAGLNVNVAEVNKYAFIFKIYLKKVKMHSRPENFKKSPGQKTREIK